MKPLHIIAAAAALSLPMLVTAQDAQQRAEWNRPFAPFRIIDNVYYVGPRGLAAYLITDPAGHILIDGGLPESAPVIEANIRKLGFRLRDVRYLLINHAHYDHSGGLAELRRKSGAKLWASAGDRKDLETGLVAGRPEMPVVSPVHVDHIVADGAILRSGATRLRANLTPGHTRGCTSWSMQSGKRTILFACSLTVAGQNLVDDPTYPGAAADFRRTFTRLQAVKADIFVNFHPDIYRMEEKRARQIAGNTLAFVDKGETARQVAAAESAFNAELKRQQAAKAR